MKKILSLGMVYVSAMAMESNKSWNKSWNNPNPHLLTQISAQQEPSLSQIRNDSSLVEEKTENLTQPSDISTENLITEEKTKIPAEDPTKELRIKKENLEAQLAEINNKKNALKETFSVHGQDRETAEKTLKFCKEQINLLSKYNNLLNAEKFALESQEKYTLFNEIAKISHDHMEKLRAEFASYTEEEKNIKTELEKLTELLNPQNKKGKQEEGNVTKKTIVLSGNTSQEELFRILSSFTRRTAPIHPKNAQLNK